MVSGNGSLVQPPAVSSLVRWVVLLVAAGAIFYLVAIMWTGRAVVMAALVTLGWWALVAGAGIASVSYLLRFARWHLALCWLGSPVPMMTNLLVYLSGLALTASPGKIGETFRSLLLRPLGVPVSRSLAAFFADRLSDVLGVSLLLAAAGWKQSRFFDTGTVLLVLITLGSFLLRAMVLHPATSGLCERIPRLARRPGQWISVALVPWAELWRPGKVAFFSFLAALAYGVQAAVFAWFCHLLGLDLSLGSAIEIYASAILLGAASMVPAGLGAMEAALVVQLLAQGADTAVAVSAAIAIRLVTLWLGLGIGVFSLLAVVSAAKPCICTPA
jgi:uncharacterized membrane protein YbhN (UPF0104 family)